MKEKNVKRLMNREHAGGNVNSVIWWFNQLGVALMCLWASLRMVALFAFSDGAIDNFIVVKPSNMTQNR